MMKLLSASIPDGKSSANGTSASSKSDWRDWKNVLDRVAPGLFPPELIVQVKALACELPSTHNVPLSRWSLDELTQHVCQSGLVLVMGFGTAARLGPRKNLPYSGVTPEPIVRTCKIRPELNRVQFRSFPSVAVCAIIDSRTEN